MAESAVKTAGRVGAGVGVAGAVIAATVAILGNFEGLRTKPYLDVVGVRTVCYGETQNIKKNQYTVLECKEMLAASLTKYIEAVRRCTSKAAPMPLHRQVAMISFTYNIGTGGFCKSRVARELNMGNVQRACDALLLYNRGRGRVIKGLVTRRRIERELCLRSD